MKKLSLFIVIFLVIASLTATIAFASEAQNPVVAAADTEKPALTDEQKAEVKGILSQMQELKKQLIDKYVSFGVITQEQADKMKARIDERAKIAEEKGYMPGGRMLRPGMRKAPKGNRSGCRNGICEQAPQAPAATQTAL